MRRPSAFVAVLLLVAVASVWFLVRAYDPFGNLAFAVFSLALFAVFVGREWRRSQRLSDQRARRAKTEAASTPHGET